MEKYLTPLKILGFVVAGVAMFIDAENQRREIKVAVEEELDRREAEKTEPSN